MRWLIQHQIAYKPEMQGRPLLLWGPYGWADGESSRKADGLVYQRQNFKA